MFTFEFSSVKIFIIISSRLAMGGQYSLPDIHTILDLDSTQGSIQIYTDGEGSNVLRMYTKDCHSSEILTRFNISIYTRLCLSSKYVLLINQQQCGTVLLSIEHEILSHFRETDSFFSSHTSEILTRILVIVY